MDLSIPPTNNLLTPTKKSTKNPPRNRKKIPSTNPSLIPIAPNPGRTLAPAPLNVQRIITTNKRSIINKKSNSKTNIQYHNESLIQQNSSPTNSFAESISGLMQNFDEELIASNFLPQPPPTTNILTNDSSLIRTLNNIDVRQIVNTTIQRNDSSYNSMPTLDEFNDRLDNDNEQITSFMNEDEMNFVEMNFDENTFLKQFDLEDSQIKLNINSEQNIFASLLTNNHLEQSNPLPPPPPPPIYSGSSLINNNVFTTVVPLGCQQKSSQNKSQCLPEEGVQLTARHIEPSQVATYESVKYQDILDDLVTVTDQDVLSHVQAAAAANETTDFSFALLEETNEIIKATADIQVAEETASAFVDLQYFYPIEQEQELLQKQLEECEEEKEIIPPKSNENSPITDLTSIIQINQTHSPSPIKELSLNSFDNNSRKACIIFEPILSPTQDELILESGCVNDTSIEKINSLDNNQIDELLDETYEIIEKQGQTSPLTNITVDNLDHLIEQIEEPTKKILEKNFYHYQKVYKENLKKKPKEQYEPILSVKLKLHSIYPKKHENKRKSSPSPVLMCENLRPSLKIKIRTKLPSPSPLPKEDLPPVPKIKIRKPIKKTKKKKILSPTIDEQLETEAKLSLKTEYAGLTRFEQPLAQLYHQQSSPDTRIPPTPGENEDLIILPNKQDTPTTSPPLNQNKKLSHLLNYDDEPLNNNTFITPPPEIDGNNIQQNHIYKSQKKLKKSHQNSFKKNEYHSSKIKSQVLPQPPPQSSIHIDPYAQSFHHFDPRTTPFFNFPFTNPFINPHSTPTHFHQNPIKYHYPTHQQQFAYHPHLQRQQQYNNSNFMCKFSRKKKRISYSNKLGSIFE
jgi:hypothetical protein